MLRVVSCLKRAFLFFYYFRYLAMLQAVKQSVLSFHHSPARFSKNFLLTLAIGMTFGFSFAYFMLTVISWYPQHATWMQGYPAYQRHSDDHHDPHNHNSLDEAVGPDSTLSFHGDDEEFHKGRLSMSLLFIIKIRLKKK